jgi:cytochrome c
MKKRNLLLTALASLFVVLGLIVSLRVHAVPPNFQDEILMTNLDQPVSLEFLADGTMLVETKVGTIWVSHPASGYTQLDPTPFLQLTNISTNNADGLFNIVLDPDFAVSGHYYVFYTSQSPQIRDRVSRFTAFGNTTDLATEVVI